MVAIEPPDATAAAPSPGPAIRPTPVRTDLPLRPPWAPRLDALVLRGARLLRRLLPRPSDAALEALARRDRGPRPQPLPPPTTGLQAARRAFAEGRHAEALHLFGELLDHDPANAWAWHGRGDALLLLGQAEDALTAYTRAAALAPGEGLHAGGRANALGALGRAELAAAEWRRAIALDPALTWMRDGRSAAR